MAVETGVIIGLAVVTFLCMAGMIALAFYVVRLSRVRKREQQFFGNLAGAHDDSATLAQNAPDADAEMSQLFATMPITSRTSSKKKYANKHQSSAEPSTIATAPGTPPLSSFTEPQNESQRRHSGEAWADPSSEDQRQSTTGHISPHSVQTHSERMPSISSVTHPPHQAATVPRGHKEVSAILTLYVKTPGSGTPYRYLLCFLYIYDI
jgi:hypothetical protein